MSKLEPTTVKDILKAVLISVDIDFTDFIDLSGIFPISNILITLSIISINFC